MPIYPSSNCAYASLVLVLFAPLTAQAGCLLTDLVKEGTSVAVIRSQTPHVYFRSDDQTQSGCPDKGTVCRSDSYVTSGDIVLTGPTYGAFTCTGYGGLRGSVTIGWLPNASLSPLPEAERVPSDWTGHWVGDQDIIISSGKDGGFWVKGTGTWGRDHVGKVSGEAQPVSNVLAFTMGDDRTMAYEDGDDLDCRIKMWRRGPYLLAQDNRQGGGVNVTFSGFYRRMTSPH